MTTHVTSATLWGTDAHPVQIEVQLLSGASGFEISGLAEAASRPDGGSEERR